MMARIVGARELKTRLGSYLHEVRRGRTIVVTERGEPVAELRPLAPAKAGDTADQLVALGFLSRATNAPRGPLPPHPAPGAVTRQRGRGRSGGSLLITYLDASALVKRYVEEAHSGTVRRLLRSRAIATSRLSEVEVASAAEGLSLFASA